MYIGETDTKFIIKQLTAAQSKIDEVLELLKHKNPFADDIADEEELIEMMERLEEEIEFWRANKFVYTE